MFLSCYIRFLLNVLIMLYTFPIKCSYHVIYLLNVLSCYIHFLLNVLIMLYTFPIKQMFLSCYIRFLLNKCSYHVIYVSY